MTEVTTFREKQAGVKIGDEVYDLTFNHKRNRIEGRTEGADKKVVEFTISYKSGFVEVEMKKPAGTLRKPELEATYILKDTVVDMTSQATPHKPINLNFKVDEEGVWVPVIAEEKLGAFGDMSDAKQPRKFLSDKLGLHFDVTGLFLKPDEIHSGRIHTIMKNMDNEHFAELIDINSPGVGTDLDHHLKDNLFRIADVAESIKFAFNMNKLLWEIEHTSDPELQKMRVSAEMRKKHGLD